MKWRNSKERELLSSGGSREATLPNKGNPNPDLSDVRDGEDMEEGDEEVGDAMLSNHGDHDHSDEKFDDNGEDRLRGSGEGDGEGDWSSVGGGSPASSPARNNSLSPRNPPPPLSPSLVPLPPYRPAPNFEDAHSVGIPLGRSEMLQHQRQAAAFQIGQHLPATHHPHSHLFPHPLPPPAHHPYQSQGLQEADHESDIDSDEEITVS